MHGSFFAWPIDPPYRPLTNEVAEVEPEIVKVCRAFLTSHPGAKRTSRRAISPCRVKPWRLSNGSDNSSISVKTRWMGASGEWWAKSLARVLPMAGTLCYLAWAMADGPEPERIEQEYVQAAIRLVRDYFWPHSRAALAQVEPNERHATRPRAVVEYGLHEKTEVSLKNIRPVPLSQSLNTDQTQSSLGWPSEGRVAARDHHIDGRRQLPSVGGKPEAFHQCRKCRRHRNDMRA